MHRLVARRYSCVKVPVQMHLVSLEFLMASVLSPFIRIQFDAVLVARDQLKYNAPSKNCSNGLSL